MLKCPYCGKEMLQGKLIGGTRALRWQPADRSTFCTLFHAGGLPIGTHIPCQKAEACTWYCSYCRKMIIDVDEC